ncbi:MAG: helix-turn-helix transcriptional regulator [Rickettsiales bacterium]|jgi:transcriptional regulator with XRE-family HTH domain|nr:helix-turn-helix transcriptional regulator [Rickettsiales bacterium]
MLSNNDILKNNVRKIRELRNITMEDLSKCLKITRQQLFNIEKGYSNITASMSKSLCLHLDCNVNDLFTDRLDEQRFMEQSLKINFFPNLSYMRFTDKEHFLNFLNDNQLKQIISYDIKLLDIQNIKNKYPINIPQYNLFAFISSNNNINPYINKDDFVIATAFNKNEYPYFNDNDLYIICENEKLNICKIRKTYQHNIKRQTPKILTKDTSYYTTETFINNFTFARVISITRGLI